jgi:hypothetical protein
MSRIRSRVLFSPSAPFNLSAPLASAEPTAGSDGEAGAARRVGELADGTGLSYYLTGGK